MSFDKRAASVNEAKLTVIEHLFKIGSREQSTAYDDTLKSDRLNSTDRNTIDSQRQTHSIFAPFQSIPTQANRAFDYPKTPNFNFTRTHLLLRGCEKLIGKDKTKQDTEFVFRNSDKLPP